MTSICVEHYAHRQFYFPDNWKLQGPIKRYSIIRGSLAWQLSNLKRMSLKSLSTYANKLLCIWLTILKGDCFTHYSSPSFPVFSSSNMTNASRNVDSLSVPVQAHVTANTYHGIGSKISRYYVHCIVYVRGFQTFLCHGPPDHVLTRWRTPRPKKSNSL